MFARILAPGATVSSLPARVDARPALRRASEHDPNSSRPVWQGCETRNATVAGRRRDGVPVEGALRSGGRATTCVSPAVRRRPLRGCDRNGHGIPTTMRQCGGENGGTALAKNAEF